MGIGQQKYSIGECNSRKFGISGDNGSVEEEERKSVKGYW
jgi:hypothetical protein